MERKGELPCSPHNIISQTSPVHRPILFLEEPF